MDKRHKDHQNTSFREAVDTEALQERSGRSWKAKQQNQSEKGKDFGAYLGTRIIKTHLVGKLETRRRCRSVLEGYRKTKITENFEEGKDFGAHLGTELRKNTNKCRSKQHPQKHSKTNIEFRYQEVTKAMPKFTEN